MKTPVESAGQVKSWTSGLSVRFAEYRRSRLKDLPVESLSGHKIMVVVDSDAAFTSRSTGQSGSDGSAQVPLQQSDLFDVHRFALCIVLKL